MPQDSIAYTITVKNSGTASATSLAVIDTVPLFLTVVPGSITGAGVLVGRIITFAPFTLASGDSLLLSFTAIIDTNIPDQAAVNNVARIDANGIVEHVTVSFTASNRPNMSLAKSADKLTPLPGDTVTYTITYSSVGTGIATNVVITDTIPNHTAYVPQSVTLNGDLKTDEPDGDEVVVSGVLVQITLNTNLRPSQGGIVRFKVRVQ